MAAVITHEGAKAADREYLIRHSSFKGYQYLSLLTPPLYTIFVLARRGRSGWTLNKFLRASWLGGVSGVVSGGGFEYLRTMQSSEEILRDRRIQYLYNVSSLRGDDHSTIGLILGAIVTPAIFWKHGRSVHLLLGGAGLGTGAGLFAHFIRPITIAPSNPSPATEITIPELKP